MTAKTSARSRRARQLRRDATEAENRLWFRLRSRQRAGAKFRRQEPIGPFTVDFCSVEATLVVEVDGGQHAERELQDTKRTEFLERSGYRVLRFWNHEVLNNLDGVLEQIDDAVTSRTVPRLQMR